MKEFPINRGIGKSVEFQGLKSQYLFIFAGGLLGVFIVYVILYLIGIPQWFCLSLSVFSALTLVWQIFSLNTKYGEYGMMKQQSKKYHPRYVINRERFSKLFSQKK